MEWQERYNGLLLNDNGSYGQIYEIFFSNGEPTGNVIKVLREDSTDPTDRRRILREIHCLRELSDSAYVIDILDFDETASYPWFMMPKADLTLYDYVVQCGGLTEEECILIFRKILAGMDAAHRKQIYHRDISPHNILLIQSDTREYNVYVADFSLGRDFRKQTRKLTRSIERHLGHTAFAAPEQWEDLNAANHRSDIYSVGSVLSFMLNGGRDPDRFAPDQSILYPLVLRMRKFSPTDRPSSISDVTGLLNRITSTTQLGTRVPFEDIVQFYQQNTHLDDSRFEALEQFLIKANALFNRGAQTYSLYFYPLISNFDLIKYWITYADEAMRQMFFNRFSEQVIVLIGQTGWTFRNMIHIAELLYIQFDMTERLELKTQILQLMVQIRQGGFGEVSGAILKILTAQYENYVLVQEISLFLEEHKDAVVDLIEQNSDKIRHYAFLIGHL